MLVFPKPRSIEDLESHLQTSRASRRPVELRREVPIAVVDDQPFAPSSNLAANGFVLQYFNDVTTLDTLRDFPIVLCDIRGVGRYLSSADEGAHLIREIKRNYPEKITIAYTGGAQYSRQSRLAAFSADHYLRKDADLDDWLQLLDKSISEITDPITVWNRFRRRLLDHGVSPYQLTVLEDAFVRSYYNGEECTRTAIFKVISRSDVKTDVRAIVNSFIASLLFKILFT